MPAPKILPITWQLAKLRAKKNRSNALIIFMNTFVKVKPAPSQMQALNEIIFPFLSPGFPEYVPGVLQWLADIVKRTALPLHH